MLVTMVTTLLLEMDILLPSFHDQILGDIYEKMLKLRLLLTTQFFPLLLSMLIYLPQLLMRPCDKDLLVEGVMNSFESLTKFILC
jgi:hypothetical protein